MYGSLSEEGSIWREGGKEGDQERARHGALGEVGVGRGALGRWGWGGWGAGGRGGGTGGGGGDSNAESF